LKSSSIYAKRLIGASRLFSESSYHFHRRVNWSYRFSKNFYDNESIRFAENPQRYINNEESTASLENIFEVNLSRMQVSIIVLKVIAHWVFYFYGKFFSLRSKKKFSIYRKAYVDDIELVYDPDQQGVLRAVYPFPLNIGRQLRYLSFLRRSGYIFKTDGNPYSPFDLFKFLLKRNLYALQRMESRAQIRHAHEVAASGFDVIQMSDEFDVGNLDFCRAIRRFKIRIINSAHGVGSYLPIHAYHEFYVLTHRQITYYKSIYHCDYKIRPLNVKPLQSASPVQFESTNKVIFIFLSQISFSVTSIVSDNEERVLSRLKDEFYFSPEIDLLYKAHPNNHNPEAPSGFRMIKDLKFVNGHPGVVFASLFSTCYLDPNFIGKKFLIRTGLIYPELIFDNTEDILNLEELVQYLVQQVADRG
jgi:hypothetical protein